MGCFSAIALFSVFSLLFPHLSCVDEYVQTPNFPSDLLNGGFNSMNAPVVGRQGSEVWADVVRPRAAVAGLGASWNWTLEFKDGRGQVLQICCGVYTQPVLQELDLVISEARKNGNRLILCLMLYLRRPTDPDGDAFHTSPVVINLKKQIKRLLTRINMVTGVAYRDEPAIMGLKLIFILHPQGGIVVPNLGKLNLSGWIQNMASFVKSIDGNHLLTVGVEENGGSNASQKKIMNPRYQRRFLTHMESPPPSLVEESLVKAGVPPTKPSGCTSIPTNATGHCPNN